MQQAQTGRRRLLLPANGYLFKKSPHCSLQRKAVSRFQKLNWRSAKGNSVCCRGLDNKMLCIWAGYMGKSKWRRAAFSSTHCLQSLDSGAYSYSKSLMGSLREISCRKRKKKKMVKGPQMFSPWVQFSIWKCSPSGKPNVA